MAPYMFCWPGERFWRRVGAALWMDHFFRSIELDRFKSVSWQCLDVARFLTVQENIVNRLQRQLEGVLLNFRMLEQKLEAKGLNLKDLGITTGELGSE